MPATSHPDATEAFFALRRQFFGLQEEMERSLRTIELLRADETTRTVHCRVLEEHVSKIQDEKDRAAFRLSSLYGFRGV